MKKLENEQENLRKKIQELMARWEETEAAIEALGQTDVRGWPLQARVSPVLTRCSHGIMM